jgi:hypothetical protein
MERVGGSWGEPHNMGAPIDTDGSEYFPSLTRDGTLYLTRARQGEREDVIYRSRLRDGRYQEPERLPAQVNAGKTRYNAFVAPDESYLVLSIPGLPNSIGRTDYCIVFRSPDDTWSEPVNLGATINTPGGVGYSPYVTSDGRFFFFMSARKRRDPTGGVPFTRERLQRLWNEPENGHGDIYWVDASFLTRLRPQATAPAGGATEKPPRRSARR